MDYVIGLGTHLTAKEVWLQVIGWSLIVAIPIVAVYADGWERERAAKRRREWEERGKVGPRAG
jgi:hypothetical protein